MIKEIAQKYENVQKGVGDMMGGALIETEARTILNQGISQGISQGLSQGISQGLKQGLKQGLDQGASMANRKTAFRMLKGGKLTIPEIVEYTGLSVAEVELLALSGEDGTV